MEDLNNLKRLFDMAKVMKANTINIYKNKIIGLDSSINPISNISIVYTNTLIDEKDNCLKFELFANYLKGELDYLPLQSPKGIKESYILDNFKEPTNMIYKHDDLKSIEEFNNILAKKAKDGVSFMYIDKYPISIYSGLLPINKSDKVSLEIYDDNVLNSFVAKFIIDKKKFTINKYIRYMYLDRR